MNSKCAKETGKLSFPVAFEILLPGNCPQFGSNKISNILFRFARSYLFFSDLGLFTGPSIP